jgi:hypothetical protein
MVSAPQGAVSGGTSKKKSQPISRVLSWTAIHLGRGSLPASSSLPGSRADRTCGSLRLLPYLALLRVGFSVPRTVTRRAVRSYRTFSPLPALLALRRYVFCGTFRGLAPPRRYLAPCPVEPGLSSMLAHCDCLADSGAIIRGSATPGREQAPGIGAADEQAYQ